MRVNEHSSIYGLLSRIYSKEPSQEFLRSFRAPAFLRLLKELDIELGEDFKNRPLEKLVDELAIEYTQLFIGPGRHIYPYESAYRDGKEGVSSNTAIQIKNIIESSGLQYRSDFRDNFDHISIELEFMEKITGEEAKAWKKKNRKRAIEFQKFKKRFVDEHLSKWVPEFSDRVIKETTLSFYREMAKLTKEYILADN